MFVYPHPAHNPLPQRGLFVVCGFSGGYHGYQDESYGAPYEGRRMGPPVGGPRRGGTSQRYGAQYGPPPPPPGEYGAHADSPVIMVYGLEPSKINADRVFNIFCLFGNVERVCRTAKRKLDTIKMQTILSEIHFCPFNVGEIHEEQAWSCYGGDGRLLCCGSCHLTSQQQLPVQSEAQCLVIGAIVQVGVFPNFVIIAA